MCVMKNYKLIFVSVLLVFTVFVFACKKPVNSSDVPSVDVEIQNPTLPENQVPSTPEVPTVPEVPPLETPENPTTPEVMPEKTYAVYLRSTVNGLSVRAGAGTGYKKVGYIDKGDMLAFVGYQNGWYETVYKQKTAYVYADYIQKVNIEKTDSLTEDVIKIGEELLGYPYVYGSQRYHWGNGVLNKAFVDGEYDCSALMQYMFYKGAGVNLDVTSRLQSVQGKPVTTLKRGDVMFFTNASGQYKTGVERIRHVGLYLGDNYILHTASDYAVIEEISSTRWGYFMFAKKMV